MLRNKSSIRPLDIKENLPEPWKGIQSADLADILNSFVRIGVLEKVATTDIKYNKGHRWGRPKKNSATKPYWAQIVIQTIGILHQSYKHDRQSPYR